MEQLQSTIERAWEERAALAPGGAHGPVREAVDQAIELLDQGRLRGAEKIAGEWVTHQWVKKAVLLSFRLQDNFVLQDGYTRYYDKVRAKFDGYTAEQFQRAGMRVVPAGGGGKAALCRGELGLRNVCV